MKKILLPIVALSLFTVQAAEIRLGSAVVAGRDKLGEAAFKLGMMSGNMMVGGFLQGALAEAPKKATTYAIVFDTETKEPDFRKIEACEHTPKLAQGELVKAAVCPKGLAELCALEPIAKEMTEECNRIVKDLTEAIVVVKLDNSGITAKLDIAVTKDSELLSEEDTPLGENALGLAPKSALFAAVVSRDVGTDFSLVRKVFAIFEKHGIALDCLTLDGEGSNVAVSIDPKLIKSTIEKNQAVCASIDRAALKGEIEALQANAEEKTPAGSAIVSIKGYECAYTPAERFAATLPELQGKRLYTASVWSYYSIFKAIAPHVEAMRPMTAMLPGESKAAIACAGYDDKSAPERGSYVMRVSAEEIKSLGMAGGIVMAAAMSQEVGCEDDEDDED